MTGVFTEKHRKGEQLTIEGTGKQFRDFIHVKDVCRGMILGYQDPSLRTGALGKLDPSFSNGKKKGQQQETIKYVTLVLYRDRFATSSCRCAFCFCLHKNTYTVHYFVFTCKPPTETNQLMLLTRCFFFLQHIIYGWTASELTF